MYSITIGIIGDAFIIAAYFLLINKIISEKNIFFSLLNAIGSISILISLFYFWNTSAALLELVWFIISVIGIVKGFKHIKNA